MAKIAKDGFGSIGLIAVVIILSAITAGCFGKPQAELDITATAASGLVITHKDGDTLTLKDERITVEREVSGKIVDGLDGVPMYGSAPEFQDAPAVETLAVGQKIRHTWRETLLLRDVLVVTILDEPSGRVVAEARVTVM